MIAINQRPADPREIQRLPGIDNFVLFGSDTGKKVIGQAKDLSPKGVGILTSRYFPVGTIVQIHVPASSSVASSLLPAVIQHSTAQPDGAWLLGCVFSRMLSLREISALWRRNFY